MANVLISRLTLIKKTKGSPNPKGLYQCECGVIKEMCIGNVNSGHTKSCGCLRKDIVPKNSTHLLKWHPLYSVWGGIKNRCYNPKIKDYHLYGGRGVEMCVEWQKDFKSFYDWALANGWRRGLKIDKDIKGNGLLYSPDTCSVVTNKENCNKTKSCIFIEYEGVSKNITQWSEYFGVSAWTFRYRMRKCNWNIKTYIDSKDKWRKK